MIVPLDINEAVIDKQRMRDRGSGGYVPDAALDILHSAVAETRKTAEKLAALAEALGNDRTITPEAAALKLRRAALKLGETSATKLDAARARAAREVETLRKNTASPPPPKDALAMQLEAELRQRICAMRDDERSKLVGAALKSGDQAVLAAVLRGHHALVGMSETQHNVYREQWRHAAYPQETDRIQRLNKALAATDRAGQCLLGMVESAVKNPVAVKAEQTAERTRALEAAE